MALYKYWKKFFPFPTTIITNTAISHRYFYYKDYRDSIEKPSQFMHNVVGSMSGCEAISLKKEDSLLPFFKSNGELKGFVMVRSE